MPTSVTNSYSKLFVSLLLACIICLPLNAQQSDIKFSVLSADCYADKIAQLKKYTVPKFYTDKSSQAWYDEILSGRNKSLIDDFENNKVVKDSLLLGKCNEILKKITAANPNFRFDTIHLFINRSIIANAACYGEGTIMINLGLFLWIDNDDELALVLGHEISHQLLNHSDSRIQKSIAMLTSEEFVTELNKIKKADYGKFDRYRKLMKGLNVESGKHSTYKESEADSLGVVLIKNAGFNIATASKVLLKLDKVEELFTSDKLYSPKDFITKAQIDPSYFVVKPKYNGLSSIKVTMNADKDLDSIKTHPDCARRYAAISGSNTAATVNCCSALNISYKNFKERAMLELVRYEYENNKLGLCIHLCMFALQNQYNASTYNYFLSLCFSKLVYKDKNLERFNAANAYAEAGSNLKELQDFLFNCSTADLEKLAAYFLNINGANSTEDADFATMMYNTQVKMKDEASAYNSFKNKYPASKYNYLIQKK
ncbi:M48 family metallopeptidase [Ferruginibacter profundus]